MALLLGCIADDFTGATDLANNLVRYGMRTMQLIGVPDAASDPGDVDAIVVALKSRTIPAAEAVAQSLAALSWLQAKGARQIFFKYCSTFDSTAAGNIGPVADALLDALGGDFTIACPAFPATGRTIYKGLLFVGDVPLDESGMRDHPLTPMRDADLVRVLGAQTAGGVGLVPYQTVADGTAAVRGAFAAVRTAGKRYAITDAIADSDLFVVGEAVADLPLVTGGSGIAIGLPANFRRAGLLPERVEAGELPKINGLEAVIAGSCSGATQGQVANFAATRPALRVDPLALARGEDEVARVLAAAGDHLGEGPVLVYATAKPEEVLAVQEALGRERAGALVEAAMAGIARGLVELGVRRLVVAGGETSGAVVTALGVTGLRIGRQIDPGVPATVTTGATPLALALKSGNFGGPDFFTRAFDVMPGGRT